MLALFYWYEKGASKRIRMLEKKKILYEMVIKRKRGIFVYRERIGLSGKFLDGAFKL